MSRTPLNADAAQALVNQIFGGDSDTHVLEAAEENGALAVFNAVFELKNRKLVPLDAGDDAADDDAVELVGLIGHCHLEGEEFSYRETIDERDPDRDEIFRLAEEAIGGLPVGELITAEATQIDTQFPSTLAVMAVWRGADGRCWPACYRHPQIAAATAASILKAVAEEYRDDEPAMPAPSN